MIYAVVDGARVVERREIVDWDNYEQLRKDARDERGDGGPTIRPITYEGDGPLESQVLERDRLRIIRSHPPLDEIKREFIIRIDNAAIAERQKHITPGMDAIYAEKAVQAQEIARMGADADALSETDRAAMFPTVAASVGTEAATLSECATLILQRYAADAVRTGAIERTRLAGKKAIRNATTRAEANAVYEAIKWPT